MKKTYIIAGFAAALLACNSHSDHGGNNADTLNHAGHQKTTPGTTDTATGNTMSKIMANMMQEMHKITPTDIIDIDFIRMMVMHHQGAVEMSKAEINTGRDSSMKAFAQTVKNDQGKEIIIMEEFILTSPKNPSANAADFQKAMNNSMMAMMKETALYNDIDKDYAAQMIPHHQSAVDMAKAYLAHGKTPALVTLCNNIITSQAKEITWLTAWLNRNK
jgi:uncharacterized protein (DUF305 family)